MNLKKMSVKHQINKISLTLLKQRALYIESENILIVSDLHIGKSSHFRKNGIAVPNNSDLNINLIFFDLIENLKVDKVIFLGDLFHSEWNLACENFSTIISNYQHVNFILVKGNHDKLKPDFYKKCGITEIVDEFRMGKIVFSHDAISDLKTDEYNIHGHLHPTVKLKGNSKQSLRLNCFYFGEKYGVLPAFNQFTGKYLIDIKKGDTVYGITENDIILL
jgi:uncharacterized protein